MLVFLSSDIFAYVFIYAILAGSALTIPIRSTFFKNFY